MYRTQKAAIASFRIGILGFCNFKAKTLKSKIFGIKLISCSRSAKIFIIIISWTG